jgi:ABC-2 type transport system permease protein
MQQLGKMTFNAWALDGYKKVFWYDMPVNELGLELLVLGSIALYLAAAARILAIRWERG